MTRTEHDFLGTIEFPLEVLWGIHTGRAIRNFPLSHRKVHPHLIQSYALVKKACCVTNRELGYLDDRRADAICTACEEIASGKFSDQFPLDSLQGGAGTSTNMNLNEVIANRANMILGLAPGTYSGDGVHPLDHVNLHQSTNDTYPTALKVCMIAMIRSLASAVEKLQGALQRKEQAFAHIVTVGRTELQPAVPMTLGSEFGSFAECISRDRWRAFKCEERLRVVNLGGTAVGTGLTAPRRYIFRVTDVLRTLTGYGLARAENLVDQTANADSLVEVSGILKAHAANLTKVARDLRFLSQAGEIILFPVQAGSSVMPGKVNPVILEAVIQAGLKVRMNDTLVGEAVAHGSLQINEYMPLIADTLTESLDLLQGANLMLANHVEKIEADRTECEKRFSSSPVIVTALLPFIGYEKAACLLAEFTQQSNLTIREFLAEKLGKDLVEQNLSPTALSALGYQD
ncbi:MAG: aspartate ammonia-lyase [Spirochaetales bacterium]